MLFRVVPGSREPATSVALKRWQRDSATPCPFRYLIKNQAIGRTQRCTDIWQTRCNFGYMQRFFMNSVSAMKWRSGFARKFTRRERCAITRILWVAIILSVNSQVSARSQYIMPLAANAFEPKGSPLPVIRPARETDPGPQTGAYELQFWSAGGGGVRIAQSSCDCRPNSIVIRKQIVSGKLPAQRP